MFLYRLKIEKKEFKRFKARYDDEKKVIVIDMKGDVQ